MGWASISSESLLQTSFSTSSISIIQQTCPRNVEGLPLCCGEGGCDAANGRHVLSTSAPASCILYAENTVLERKAGFTMIKNNLLHLHICMQRTKGGNSCSHIGFGSCRGNSQTLHNQNPSKTILEKTLGSGGGAKDPNHIMMTPTVSAAAGYKWRLVIAYDGTHYAGWQYQQSPPTIQCTLEKALTQATKLERKDLVLVGASRTDRGVHAWAQVAHFVTPFNYDNLASIHAALNGLLPSDIRVREISPAVPEFHARFSAKSKVYHYKIFNDSIMDPFQRRYAYHSTYKLNTALMREAASYFVGKHDFSAFVNASHNDGVPDPVKTIFRFDIIEMGALLQLEVEGSGFLYRQVRNMVALLLQIGKEALPCDIVPMILASRDRKELAKYALAAPPHGLCLVTVKYNEEHLRLPSGCPNTSFGRHHTVSKCKLPFY